MFQKEKAKEVFLFFFSFKLILSILYPFKYNFKYMNVNKEIKDLKTDFCEMVQMGSAPRTKKIVALLYLGV